MAVVIAMMAMRAFRDTGGGQAAATDVVLSLAWRLGAVGALLYVLMRWPLPRLAATMARSQELLLVFAVA